MPTFLSRLVGKRQQPGCVHPQSFVVPHRSPRGDRALTCESFYGCNRSQRHVAPASWLARPSLSLGCLANGLQAFVPHGQVRKVDPALRHVQQPKPFAGLNLILGERDAFPRIFAIALSQFRRSHPHPRVVTQRLHLQKPGLRNRSRNAAKKWGWLVFRPIHSGLSA